MAGLFENRVALITGSSSGIGAGVAAAFAREGARVAINYPNAAQLDNAQAVVSGIAASGGNAVALQADVSSEAEVDAMVAAAETQLGPVDILVNNAGIANVAPVHELAVADWDRAFAVHVRSVFLTTRRVIPGMYERDYGRIINTASQLAYNGAPGLTHYTACKGAIVSFTRSVALEIGSRDVNINTVAPGATRTPILDDVDPGILEAIRQQIPKGRLAEVDDIVPTYVFLASEGARHIQGQCISPNGGDMFL
ncbi:MAG: SDR family oxidoreductase [Gammaproteobacteria bacterium]|nr:SDR family oxidoreductase [Gammaproteobacteria bacterium]